MKNLALMAGLAVAVSAALAAQEGNPLPEPVVKSTVTQQQLRAELAAFKATTSHRDRHDRGT